MRRKKPGGLAQHTNEKQLVSPKGCLQGPAIPTKAFLQADLVAWRNEARCGPRGGRAMEGWEMRVGAEEREAESCREREEREEGGKKESANPNVDL